MKPLPLALLISVTLPALGLAGCQTVEDDGYSYSTTYEEDVYVGRPVYESRAVVRRPPPVYAWTPPPPPVVHRRPPPPPPPTVRRWSPPPPPPPPVGTPQGYRPYRPPGSQYEPYVPNPHDR